MKIKKAADLSGLSVRNVRFYEEMGLITTGRDESGYREYNEEDIQRLRQIKVLRDLGITMENIKKYFNSEISLNELMKERKAEIELQQKDMKNLFDVVSQIENQNLPLSSYTTDLYQSMLEKKQDNEKQYGKLITGNIKQKMNRKSILVDFIITLIVLTLMLLIVLPNLIHMCFEYNGKDLPISVSTINILIIFLSFIFCWVVEIFSSKTKYFELREDGVYYLDKNTKISSWDCFKYIMKNKVEECMEFISYETISAVKVNVQESGMITGGDYLFKFYIIIFTTDDRVIRLDSKLFSGEEHFMTTFRILHDKAPKWIDPKNLAKILELPNDKAYKIINKYLWSQRPWHNSSFFKNYGK